MFQRFLMKVSRVSQIRVGRDQFFGRDREIRPTKIQYETEIKKKWMLIFLSRRDSPILIYPRRDQDEMRLKILRETKTRPRVSVSFSTGPRREPSFNEEND